MQMPLVRSLTQALPIKSKYFGLISASFIICACSLSDPAEVISRDPRTGLTENEANQVLATVGKVEITLGEYAESLLRMGEYQRLRYQSKERQAQLLDELIDLELFAQEARRLGLDKQAEVQLAIDQAQRDEVLAQLKLDSIKASEISQAEVGAYFEEHHSEFREPERRRVLVIELESKSLGEKVLKKALNSDGKAWGNLSAEYLSREKKAAETGAIEYRGDLGFTSQAEQKLEGASRVPDAVSQAVFQLKELGEVFNAVVETDGRYYIVRLGAISAARDRSLSSAAPVIRIELARQKYLEKEKELVEQLRQRYPVQILP